MVLRQTVCAMPEMSEVACDQTLFLVPPPTASSFFGMWPMSR